MMSIITVDKVPIPIFGAEEINQAVFDTKSLQLEAAFASKGCTPVWSATKFTNLPANKNATNQSNEQKAAVKMNKTCCSILITSFSGNPSLHAMIQQTIEPGWVTGQAWIVKQAIDDYFGEIDEDKGAEAKKKALDEIQMGIGNDLLIIFNKLWQQYAIWSKDAKLWINDDEMRLQIKTKMPTKIYGDVIKIAQKSVQNGEERYNS